MKREKGSEGTKAGKAGTGGLGPTPSLRKFAPDSIAFVSLRGRTCLGDSPRSLTRSCVGFRRGHQHLAELASQPLPSADSHSSCAQPATPSVGAADRTRPHFETYSALCNHCAIVTVRFLKPSCSAGGQDFGLQRLPPGWLTPSRGVHTFCLLLDLRCNRFRERPEKE